MNYYDVIFAQQKAKKDSKYFDEISDAINVLAGTETTYTPSEMAPAIIDAIPTETASGNPINITDAAHLPAESMVTTLEPIQDLHGYDKPWPAGGGKNLLDTSTVTIPNITFTQGSNGYITASPNTADSRIWSYSSAQYKVTLPAGLYKLVAEVQTPTTSSSQGIAIFDSLSHTVVQEQSLFSTEGIKTIDFELSENSDIGVMAKIYEGIVRFMICKQTDTTSYEPYSNECPISGHTGVELTRTGKNLFDYTKITLDRRIDITNGNAVGVGSNNFEVSDYITIVGGQTYTLNFSYFSSANYGMAYYDMQKNYISGQKMGAATGRTPFAFTAPNNARYVRFTHVILETMPASEVMLELGSTATSYEPYTPETHTQTFPQTQSPVYGCDVDWVNGVLRVTEVKQKLQNMLHDRSKAGFIRVMQQFPSSAKVPRSSQTLLSNALVSDYTGIIGFSGNPSKPYSFWYTERAVYVALSTDDFATANDWNTYLNNNDVYIIYELATPLEIPLTSEVITLLKGENNVWTDSGTSEVEYKVDLQSYIQKLIDEASAQASTLSMSPLSLGRSAVLTSTDGESEEAEDLPVEDVESVDEVEEEPVEDKKADEPAEESEKAEDLTVKKEIAEELAETEKVEDIKETEEHESEVEE